MLIEVTSDPGTDRIKEHSSGLEPVRHFRGRRRPGRSSGFQYGVEQSKVVAPDLHRSNCPPRDRNVRRKHAHSRQIKEGEDACKVDELVG